MKKKSQNVDIYEILHIDICKSYEVNVKDKLLYIGYIPMYRFFYLLLIREHVPVKFTGFFILGPVNGNHKVAIVTYWLEFKVTIR